MFSGSGYELQLHRAAMRKLLFRGEAPSQSHWTCLATSAIDPSVETEIRSNKKQIMWKSIDEQKCIGLCWFDWLMIDCLNLISIQFNENNNNR